MFNLPPSLIIIALQTAVHADMSYPVLVTNTVPQKTLNIPTIYPTPTKSCPPAYPQLNSTYCESVFNSIDSCSNNITTNNDKILQCMYLKSSTLEDYSCSINSLSPKCLCQYFHIYISCYSQYCPIMNDQCFSKTTDYYCDSCWNSNFVEPTRTVTVATCETPPPPKYVNGCDNAYVSFSQCNLNSTITNELQHCANARLMTLSSNKCRNMESNDPQCDCDQYKVYMSCYKDFCPGLKDATTDSCFSKIISLDFVCDPAYSSCWRAQSTKGIPNSPICTFIINFRFSIHCNNFVCEKRFAKYWMFLVEFGAVFYWFSFCLENLEIKQGFLIFIVYFLQFIVQPLEFYRTYLVGSEIICYKFF